MKYAYYPGCSLHTTAGEYDTSTRAVCRKIGIELVEIPGWNCCGASSAGFSGTFLSVTLPGRNLVLAEQAGLDVTAPCSVCYQRLMAAHQRLTKNFEERLALKDAMGGIEYKGTIAVKTIVEVVARNLEAGQVINPLRGLKVVCYYGCQMVKPPKVACFDNPEDPLAMDQLVNLLGAEAVQWPLKTECCGGSLPFYREEPAFKLFKELLQIARDSGAQALVTACPLCMSNLDMRQAAVEKKYGVKFELPVLYITELAGLALGIKPAELGLAKHFVNPFPLLMSMEIV